ncbi:MAG: polysaccharide biosynthesis C-terminal domain-containing protein [Erysipelotrichaceae bacterium]|nr:polysaccharide biosynthesis C-terminal domain-containing protein [Erysipelotrichaceae bacterium]
MTDKKGIAIFEDDNISRALIRLAIPSVTISLITIIYEMIHQVFIAQLNDTAMLASTSCTVTLVLIITQIGEAVGVGGSTYLGRQLGAGNSVRSKEIVRACITLDLFLSLILMAICLLVMKPYIYWQTSDPAVIRYATSYGYIAIISSIFQVFQLTLCSLFRGAGDVRFPLKVMLMSVVITIALDPLFMFVCHLGIAGAALSTSVAALVSCVLCFYHLLSGKTYLSWKPGGFGIDEESVRAIFSVGSSVYLRNFMASFSMAVFSKQVFVYGTEFSAGCNVGKYAIYFVNFFIQGVCNGLLPFASYAYGADDYPRLYQAAMWSFKVLTAYCIMAMLFMAGCAEWFISFFTRDPVAISYGTGYLKAYNYSLLLYSVYYIITTLLQASGRGKASMVVSLSRQGLIYVPLLIVLPMLFQENGILFSQPVADWLTVLAAIFMSRDLLQTIWERRKTPSRDEV